MRRRYLISIELTASFEFNAKSLIKTLSEKNKYKKQKTLSISIYQFFFLVFRLSGPLSFENHNHNHTHKKKKTQKTKKKESTMSELRIENAK